MKWFDVDKPYLLTSSLICGDPLRLSEEIEELEEAGIDSLHFDAMDGHFVPRIGLYPEMLRAIKSKTNIPVDVHLMVSEPQEYVSNFAEAGADLIAVHIESEGDVYETLRMIKGRNIKTGVVLKPNTDLDIIDSLLAHVDLVMLMAIHPGVLGQKILPETFERISKLSQKLKKYPNIVIEIDGGVTPQTAPEMIKCGAHLLVCGTGTIYRPHEDTLMNKIKELRRTTDIVIL